MPLTPSANYLTENAKLGRTPVYTVQFSGVSGVFATHQIPGTSWKAYMAMPNGIAARIEPDQGTSSIGDVLFTLIDHGNEITAIIAAGIIGKSVTFQGGFFDIASTDFTTFFTGVVADYDLTADGLGYQITARDSAVLENVQVFEVASAQLTADLTNTDTTASLDCTFFAASGYTVIDEEILQYSGKTGSTALTGLTRGVLGTVAAAHTSGSQVQEMLRIGPAHPFDIAVSVMTNTDKTGMSISSSLVDTAEFAAQKTFVGDVFLMEFWITSRDNGKTWLEREIFKVMAAYPFVKADGKLSLKCYRQPTTDLLDGTLTEGSVVGTPRWKGNVQSLVNHITWRYDWNPVSQEFASIYVYQRTSSITANGKKPIVIEASGIRGTLSNTAALLLARSQAIVERYASAAPLVEAEAHMQKNLLEAGDIVQLTSAMLPNNAGTRGITNQLLEVVNREIDFPSGRIRLELLWSGFAGLASVIAPASAADYNSGTAQDHVTYMYVADAAGLNPDSTPAPLIGAA